MEKKTKANHIQNPIYVIPNIQSYQTGAGLLINPDQ